MPINASIHYQKAEQEYLQAETTEQKIRALKKMISLAPKHKGAENLRKLLKRRLAKLKYTKEKEAKKGKRKLGIKKAEMQAAIIGLTNSGKSSLLTLITNAQPKIASYQYTTKQPTLGTLNYGGTKIQLIDMPAIENELCDLGIVNTADSLIIIITKIQDIKEIEPFLENATKNRLIVFNKIDLLTEQEKRKIKATLKSKKYNFLLISSRTIENIEELKEKIFQSFHKIRVYTKEPGKPVDKNEPIIIPIGSTVKDAAEKILHGLSKQVKECRVTGPSSKFPNQKTGLTHILKDKDIVEFYRR